ncbi:hypothetical protein EC957_001145 [Mortierella hygrophila]|uniref:Uncharacterized protein n=1 Tax=Mortierella hygrophila TaxID=979708 RepID=A0A9P6K7R4_9FUNG|nr:hypothetical protein EC957_001145 [Mortierella hygrophila]
MESILDLAAQFNLTPSPSAATDPLSPSSSSSQQPPRETPPTQQEQVPRSIRVAGLVLDIEHTQRQLAQMESQLRDIRKLQLAEDFSSHSINDRIRCLDTFADQIMLLHQNQAQLLDRLNRTSSSSFSFSYDDDSRHSRQQQQDVIIMDPQYHHDFVELFYQIQDEVPKIDGHLRALLGWNQQQQQDSSLMERTSSSSASSTLTSRSQNATTLDRLKTSLDGLTSLSQQQLEILEASSKLQANLIKVLQPSSSSSTMKHTMK